MSLRSLRLLTALILVLATAPAAPVAAQDAATEPAQHAAAGQDAATEPAQEAATEPGFVFLQIDGLSEPLLRTALESGHMPFLDGLIESGSHRLGNWRTTSATATPVLQAGLLHGRWRDVPGFRWWDRESGVLFDFLDLSRSGRFQDSIDGPADLLAGGGASITNLFAGGAPRVVFTATHLEGLAILWEVVRYVVDLPKDLQVVSGFVAGLQAELEHVSAGQAAPIVADVKRKAPLMIVGPALEWALVDVTSASVVREVQRGTPILYGTFTTYDEMGHYAGTEHPVALDALTHIDEAIASIAAAAERSSRPYHIVVLSDHGQTDGEPFARRYGESLSEVVRGLQSGETSDLVVAESGNLAHIYLPGQGRRLTAAEIESAHPGLIDGLAGHPGVGVVVTQADGGGLYALGSDGGHDLASGRVDGHDPLDVYGPLAAESLRNIGAAPDAGDLMVISVYDPVADEVTSFEPQLGSHGGIGGRQMEPFLLHPRELEPEGEPLSLQGVDELRARFDQWLDAPSPAHLGRPVCVSASVDGAEGEVCARRDRFGASWTMELADTGDDGRPVKATIGLGMAEAPDETATFEHDGGEGSSMSEDGSFEPRAGSAIGDLSITTCVVRRFLPDRCRTTSAALPQLSGRATAAQWARLEQLVFEEPLGSFMVIWGQPRREGVDATFDWTTNGCSAGPFAELFNDRLHDACVRHDFAYRNYGELFYDPTDEMRRRADEQLAADAAALGQEALAPGLRDTLQRFGGPAFHGIDFANIWSIPGFMALWLSTEEPASD